MTKARDISKLLSTANGKIAGENLDVSFENITDTGTEGTRVATGTTGQRGSTAGQLRFNTTTGLAEYYDGSGFKEVDAPPSISTVSSSNIGELDIANGYDLTINGSNFATGAVVTAMDPVVIDALSRGDYGQAATTAARSPCVTAIATCATIVATVWAAHNRG